jgi:hypothetical protein
MREFEFLPDPSDKMLLTIFGGGGSDYGGGYGDPGDMAAGEFGAEAAGGFSLGGFLSDFVSNLGASDILGGMVSQGLRGAGYALAGPVGLAAGLLANKAGLFGDDGDQSPSISSDFSSSGAPGVSSGGLGADPGVGVTTNFRPGPQWSGRTPPGTAWLNIGPDRDMDIVEGEQILRSFGTADGIRAEVPPNYVLASRATKKPITRSSPLTVTESVGETPMSIDTVPTVARGDAIKSKGPLSSRRNLIARLGAAAVDDIENPDTTSTGDIIPWGSPRKSKGSIG